MMGSLCVHFDQRRSRTCNSYRDPLAAGDPGIAGLKLPRGDLADQTWSSAGSRLSKRSAEIQARPFI